MKGAPFSNLIRKSSGGGAGDDHADAMLAMDREDEHEAIDRAHWNAHVARIRLFKVTIGILTACLLIITAAAVLR
jgi:hypothetical protein